MRKKWLVIVLIAIIGVSSVLAWSYTYDKKTGVYKVTLDSGKVVNVTDAHIDNANKELRATIHTDKLTIQEAVELKNITDSVIASLGGQKSQYDRNVLIIQK